MKKKHHGPVRRVLIAIALVCAFMSISADEKGSDCAPTPERRGWEVTEFMLVEVDPETLEPAGEDIPAKVPGDVYTDLMNAGRIPDPYRDENSLELDWVSKKTWAYEAKGEFKPAEGRRYRLRFMGVDYISRIELNGHVLEERHEGMFSRMEFDVTDALDPEGVQKIRVILFPVPSPSWEKLGPVLGSNEFGRSKYLKTQMSFGWDFAPRLKTCGIWDRVYFYETGDAIIKDVFVKPSLNGLVEVEVEYETAGEPGLTMGVSLNGENFEMDEIVSGPHELEGTSGVVTVQMDVPNPRLWWPWDMGDQDLYQVTVALKGQDGKVDYLSETFGIREISWGPNPDAPEGSADWVLFVNGKREFMRGANWVPPESMYGRMDDDRYIKLIDMAKGANVNMLRVWGGGNRERRAFYDYCDRVGVLVWQEFPFACVYLKGYPKTDHFKNLVRQESEEIVRQLRNHPSLIMWCGGNEFNAKQNQHVVDILEDVTSSLDDTRRFIPASPYKGDSHNWVVWHQKGNLEDYMDDVSPLPSEFGLQAFPSTLTLENWISYDGLWPLNKTHVHHSLGKDKMMKYVSALKATGLEKQYRVYRAPVSGGDNLASLTQASQVMQAYYLQRGIENWRQRKYKTSGTAFWQLNEPWPAICWSVIDYELRPKLAYNALKNSYNPLLVTAKFEQKEYASGDRLQAEIMVVNDFHREYKGVVTAKLCKEDLGSWRVAIPPDSVVTIGQIDYVLSPDCSAPELVLDGAFADWGTSVNGYYLWVHDPKPAGSVKRSLTKMGMSIMSGSKQKTWKKDEE